MARPISPRKPWCCRIGFTKIFASSQTGAPCKGQVGMLTVLLAEGLNLGLSKMAEATNTHDYFQLTP